MGEGSGDGTGEGDGRGEGEGEGRAGAAPEEGGNCALVWMSPWAVRVITALHSTEAWLHAKLDPGLAFAIFM